MAQPRSARFRSAGEARRKDRKTYSDVGQVSRHGEEEHEDREACTLCFRVFLDLGQAGADCSKSFDVGQLGRGREEKEREESSTHGTKTR